MSPSAILCVIATQVKYCDINVMCDVHFFFWTNINLNNIHRLSFLYASLPSCLLFFRVMNKLICLVACFSRKCDHCEWLPVCGHHVEWHKSSVLSLFLPFFFSFFLYFLILNLFQMEIVIHVYRIARHLWAPCWMARVPFLSFLFLPPSFPYLSGHGLQVSQGEIFITSLYTAELTVGLLRSSLSEPDHANLRSCLHRYSNNTCPARCTLNPPHPHYINWQICRRVTKTGGVWTLISRVGDF